MEDTLWELLIRKSASTGRLNPCFNGRYSLRDFYTEVKDILLSLNPCFNGRYSLREDPEGLKEITPS